MTHDAAVERFDWLQPFRPHRLWPGGLLQTLSIKFVSSGFDPWAWPGCQPFDIEDDSTPPDKLSGMWLPSDHAHPKRSVVVFHGMGGHATSGYMCGMANALLAAGHGVVLWNNRGAGHSAEKCRRLHHPGYTDDVRRLIRHLRDKEPGIAEHGLAAVGFSLGANLLLKYLGEEGQNSAFAQAVTVSAPIDMAETSRRLKWPRNKPFEFYLLNKQRAEVMREAAELSDEEKQTLKEVKSIWELDDRFTAHRYGCSGAEEYYRRNSAVHDLDNIRTPTLLFHAADDPVIDRDIFADIKWTPEGPLYPAMAASGGHTGFYGRDKSRWHEVGTVAFFARIKPLNASRTEPR